MRYADNRWQGLPVSLSRLLKLKQITEGLRLQQQITDGIAAAVRCGKKFDNVALLRCLDSVACSVPLAASAYAHAVQLRWSTVLIAH
jgi:hypothetical protein